MDVTLNIEDLLEKRTVYKQEAKEGAKKGLIVAGSIWAALTIVIGQIYQILGRSVDWGDLISDAVIMYLVMVVFAGLLYLAVMIQFYESALDLPDDQKTVKLDFLK